jgi:TonB family protein
MIVPLLFHLFLVSYADAPATAPPPSASTCRVSALTRRERDVETTDTVAAWRDLATAYRLCANQPATELPRWQLRTYGEAALKRATTLGSADSLADAWHWFEVANTLDALVAIDPSAQASVRLEARSALGERCAQPPMRPRSSWGFPCALPVLSPGSAVIEVVDPKDADIVVPGVRRTWCNDSATVLNAVPPDVPPALRKLPPGEVQIRVAIDAEGRETDATVSKSFDERFNDTALDAARAATFAPEIQNCKPVGGQFLYRIDFYQQ